MNLHKLHTSSIIGHTVEWIVPEGARSLAFHTNDDAEIARLERYIARSAKQSYLYASGLGQEFLAGEPAIARSSDYSVYYAMEILQGEFPLGEPVIARNPYTAVEYAIHVIGHRWEMGEPAIMANEHARAEYKDFLRGILPRAEYMDFINEYYAVPDKDA